MISRIFQYRPRLFVPFLIAVFLLAIGTFGYVFIEGMSWIDALYMTVITFSTVGYSEVQPLTTEGRFFTIFLIFLGLGFIAYGIDYLLSAQLDNLFRRRRDMQKIARLQNHVVVCGYGRVGKSSVEALQESKRDVVIIEKSEVMIEELLTTKIPFIEGDATQDETLEQAGITRAWGLIVCTGNDSINLFIVLSARALNPNLHIVARTVDAENEHKMRLAGANRVVSPHHIGGTHMANIIIRPQVTDFFDVVTLDGGIELWVEELTITSGSSLVGQTVGQANIRNKTGVTIIAVVHLGKDTAEMPTADTELNTGDELIVLGTREQLIEMERLTGQ